MFDSFSRFREKFLNRHSSLSIYAFLIFGCSATLYMWIAMVSDNGKDGSPEIAAFDSVLLWCLFFIFMISGFLGTRLDRPKQEKIITPFLFLYFCLFRSKFESEIKNEAEKRQNISQELYNNLKPHLELFAKAYNESTWELPPAVYPNSEIDEHIFNEFILHLEESDFQIQRTGFNFSVFQNLKVPPVELRHVANENGKFFLSESLLLNLLSKEILKVFRSLFAKVCINKGIQQGLPEAREFLAFFEHDDEYLFAYIDYKLNSKELIDPLANMNSYFEGLKAEIAKRHEMDLKKSRVSTFRDQLNKGTFENLYSHVYDLENMDGFIFERFVGLIFQKMGYEVEVTKKTGDQGADLVVVNANGKTVVQTKRYSDKIGNDAVQQVIAAKGFYRASHGIVIANQDFTKSAKELALAHSIELWDKSKLETMMRRYPISKIELENLKSA